MMAQGYTSLYIPSGPSGKVEVPGSRARSKSGVPSILDSLKLVVPGHQ
jgi:hypothetical protein